MTKVAPGGLNGSFAALGLGNRGVVVAAITDIRFDGITPNSVNAHRSLLTASEALI